jgi:hypothetical protein
MINYVVIFSFWFIAMDTGVDFRAAYTALHQDEIAELKKELNDIQELMDSCINSIRFVQNCRGVGVRKMVEQKKARYLALHDKAAVIRKKLGPKND